jgi:hypothetical protein
MSIIRNTVFLFFAVGAVCLSAGPEPSAEAEDSLCVLLLGDSTTLSKRSAPGVKYADWVQFFLLSFGLDSVAYGQEGPFDPEDWPDTIYPDATVHYVSTDAAFPPPNDTWLADTLMIRTGGDQVTEPITIGGHNGMVVTGNFLNIADTMFTEWADDETIDILVQVYGNDALLGEGGIERTFTFLTGTLPDLNFPPGGTIPVECKNQQWNWILFRIPNAMRPDGLSRFVGSVPPGAQGDTTYGGVNGGTIRFEAVPGLIVRLVAFGEMGAFGEPDAINICSPPEACDPEPETNLVWVDVNAETSDHLEILNDGDQTVVYDEDVGPADDLRRAVRPEGIYMNFGITDNYLGLPCNDPRAMKICVEFYDDPAYAGTVTFGPEAYATDDMGGVAVYPAANHHTLAGTNRWVRRSWVVPAVNLFGVNTDPLTGGPRLIFQGAQVYLSHISLAVLRTGDHPLAGQDPLEDCYADPNICTDAYGNYAELDLENGIEDGLAPGTSGGDQEMIIEDDVGPADDLRRAIRPAFGDGTPGFAHNFLNFALVNEPLGPSSQPNAHLAMCVTYYDDPALAGEPPDIPGESFRPEVYQVERGGVLTLGFTDPLIAESLQGTDTWKEAYFEIPEIKFNGVNQGPQAAARFIFTAPIYVTRVRYAVIRPCGPQAGVNLLEDCGAEEPEEGLFSRGDANADGNLNIADAIFTLSYLFGGGPDPSCMDTADGNDDGDINIADAITVLGHLFGGTGPLPDPFAACGVDPTPDDGLSCDSYPPCE